MNERHPPRREPRLLIVDAETRPILYVALDPWELRGLGELPRAHAAPALAKLALQVRPSHVVVLGNARALSAAIVGLTARGVVRLELDASFVTHARRNATDPIAIDALYPELRSLARGPRRTRLAALAGFGFVLLASHSFTPRRYAAAGLPVRPAPRVDA